MEVISHTRSWAALCRGRQHMTLALSGATAAQRWQFDLALDWPDMVRAKQCKQGSVSRAGWEGAITPTVAAHCRQAGGRPSAGLRPSTLAPWSMRPVS